MLLSYTAKNRLIKLISYLIPSKKKKRKFRDKHLYITYSDNNQVLMILPDGSEKKIKHKVNGLNVKFEGKNNTLKFYKEPKIEKINANFHGDNSIAVVKSRVHVSLRNNCYFKIERNSNLSGVGKMHVYDDNAKIIIGDNCIISWDVDFMAVDHHTILNDNGDICNYPQPIEIKDHVWIGCGVKICKGVTIAEDNIIGMGAVVTKSFSEHNCIIAGNPAKIVKRGVNWDARKIGEYLEQNS